MKGLDLSFNQKNVDYREMKNDGVQFAIIRAGFGNDASQEDKQFQSHMDACINLGIDVGAYWMSYARSVEEARKEAQVFVSIVEKYRDNINYPLYFDWENDSYDYMVNRCHMEPPTQELISAMAEAFCLELEANGYWAGIYTNLDYYRRYFDRDLTGRFTVWLADYVGDPDYQCDMQQTTSQGQVKGINGNVDIDVCTRDFPTEIKRTEKKEEDPISIAYQIWDDIKNCWLPNVSGADQNDRNNGFAGIPGHDICAVFASLSKGNITYRVHEKDGNWLPEVTNRQDYAGKYNCPIDGFMAKTDTGKTIHYKAHLRRESRWLSGVTGYNVNDSINGYAGKLGDEIDELMMWID